MNHEPQHIIADQSWNREQRDKEAFRLRKLTGRAVDWRTTECDCDEWACCSKCAGQGAYREAFYLSCNHAVIDGIDEDCEEHGCAERERKAEAA